MQTGNGDRMKRVSSITSAGPRSCGWWRRTIPDRVRARCASGCWPPACPSPMPSCAPARISPARPKPPFTPGYELVGVVEELGPGCSRLRVGDRIGALTVWGADADRVCVPESGAVEVPEDLDPAEVLSLLFPYMTAYQVLHRTAKAKSGETVLVHGAAGRVGIAALELGAVAGLRLYGTASARDRAAVERARRGGDRLPQRGLPGAGARADRRRGCGRRAPTASVARSRFARSARCGPAEGSSCSAATPRSRTGTRTGRR